MSLPRFLRPEVVPFASVEIIRVPAPEPTPVVDVAIVPTNPDVPVARDLRHRLPPILAPECVPVVEVEVVKVGVDAHGTVRPVVDVELHPKPADQPCARRCWWDRVGRSGRVLKCRRCGRLKIAER